MPHGITDGPSAAHHFRADHGIVTLHVPKATNGRAGQAAVLFTAASTDCLAEPADSLSALPARRYRVADVEPIVAPNRLPASRLFPASIG